MHTPVTIVDNNNCNVLPSLAAGRVAYLVAPYSPMTDAVLQQYTNATLVKEPARTGGDPFKLYIVQSKPGTTSAKSVFTNTIQLVEPHAQRISVSGPPPIGGDSMMLHWRMTESQQPAWRTNYDYAFRATYSQGTAPLLAECVMTRVYQGDQLFPFFPLPSQNSTPANVTVNIAALTYVPWIVHTGPVSFLTFNERLDRLQQLVTANGQQNITLP